MQAPMEKERVSLVMCSVMWALLVTHLLALAATGSAVLIHGEVGGNVTFHCPSDQQTPYMFSLQIEDNAHHPVIVNGYYRTKAYPHTEYQRRSQVDHTRRTVVMWDLNRNDSGKYKCHMLYVDSNVPPSETTMTLVVKPKRTEPTLTLTAGDHCHDGSGCVMTCVAIGGYPERPVAWNMTASDHHHHLSRLKDDSKYDPVSQLFNITSTASVNCTSGGGPLTLRCSVGDRSSNDITVMCEGSTGPEPPGPDWIWMVAVGVLAVVVAVSLLIVLLRRKCCKSPCPDHAETGPTNPGEDVALNRMDPPAETDAS